MLHRIVPAALEDVQEADDVRVDVGVRVDQRVAHAGLRREVDHAIEPLTRKQRRHAIPVGDVATLEPEAVVRA
jgi:hypothetical protein